MLYAVSKTISEHLKTGEEYHKVLKVYHINIVYFKLGEGMDYVYYGSTTFRGKHLNDLLQLTEKEKKVFALKNRKKAKEVKDLFPEYYILCVEDFDDNAKDSLDEWIYYLKNNSIPSVFKAPGLKEARKQLKYDKLSEQEKRDYDSHIDNLRNARSSLSTAERRGEFKGLAKGEVIGLKKGEAIGLEKGEAERSQLKAELELAQSKLKDMVINMKQAGWEIEKIASFTGLTIDEIELILKK
jgi:predicted transposase YdaD